MLRELTIAARRLAADRWTAASAMLAAVLGAGLNTAVFAVAYGVLVRPLPYPDAGRLVVVSADTSWSDVQTWRDRLASLDSMAAFSQEQLTVFGGPEPQLAGVAHVDASFFATMGTRPLQGRAFAQETTLAAVSQGFARRLGDGSVLGRQLTVGGSAVTVAAVMPADFAFPTDRIDIWMPAAAARPIAFDRTADARHFQIVGRLKPGAVVEQIADEAARTRAELEPQNGRSREPRGVRVTRLDEAIVGSIRPVLLAFSAAAAIVLLIACANIGTILIGRTLARQRELAVRRALGASPMRLAASVLAESLLVAAAGAAGGVLVAAVAIRQVARFAEGLVPRLGGIGIDWTVFVFATASAALAALAGALPALRAVRAGTTALRASGAGSRPFDRRVRAALVVTQIALAVVLLAGGALLTRTIVVLLGADLGVAARGATVVPLRLTESQSFTASDRAPILGEILRRVRALPGVTAAGAGNTLPPDTSPIEVSFRFVDDRGERTYRMSAASATPGYLPAIGARLLEGRDFTDADATRDRPAIILSRTARRMMPPGEVVGRELPSTLPGLKRRGRPIVIGVVSDIKYSGLEAETGAALYVMWNEFPAGQLFMAVRSPADPAALAPSLRAIVRDGDPRMPVLPARALEDMVRQTVADRRLRALLGGAVALLAVAVAMVGLSGTLMRMVLERRQELAIRAALGATPAHTVRAVLREGATLAAVGIVIGLGGALAAGRALGAFVQGVSPHDPATLAGVAALVAAVSIAVCYLPARRASRVDPLTLLRSD